MFICERKKSPIKNQEWKEQDLRLRKNEGKDGDRKGGRREGLRDWYLTLIDATETWIKPSLKTKTLSV